MTITWKKKSFFGCYKIELVMHECIDPFPQIFPFACKVEVSEIFIY